VFTFTWNAAGRLVGVGNVTTTVVYTYNGDGVRVAQAVGGTVTTVVQDLAGGLPQVLVESTGAVTTEYVYGHDLLAEEDTAWAWHPNDGLGSVRQLADGDGDVTLAQGYTPFGVLLWREGDAASGYGFTGEQEDAAVGLVFLRARYYDPYLSRFISPDTIMPDFAHPQSLNRYAYVLGNPLKYVDPTGLYHKDVHYDLTRQLVIAEAERYGVVGGQEFMGNIIAEADQRVDTNMVLNSLFCRRCHFCDYASTTRHVDKAIKSGNPYLFGATLHQLQDYFSHWKEGYGEEGHANDTIRAGAKSGGRSHLLLDDFFEGGHMWYQGGGHEKSWEPSPYPAHPREEVIQDVQRRNPGLDVSGLSDDDLIDLYLRKQPGWDSDWQKHVEERGFFGLDPDKYIKGSLRDMTMEFFSRLYIAKFMEHVFTDPCAFDWEELSGWHIKELLIE
jgi:RHS repeat-associated protein